MVPTKLTLPIVLAMLLIASVNCNPFDNLSAADKAKLVDLTSGALSPSGTSIKGLDDAKKVLINLLNMTAQQVILSNPALATTIQTLVTSAQTIINRVQNLGDLFYLTSQLPNVITAANISPLQLVFQNFNFLAPLFSVINMDTSTTDLTVQAQFWVDFDTFASTNSNYSAIRATITMSQINAAALLLEIPATQKGKIDLFNRILQVLLANPTIVAQIEQVFLTDNATFTAAQVNILGPVLRDLKCLYLKKIDFDLLLSGWLNLKSMDPLIFDKLCRCSMVFVGRAAGKSSNTTSASLPDDIQGVIGDYMVKYLLLLGVTSPAGIIDYVGPLFLKVPAKTLDSLLKNNVNLVLDLFVKYHVASNIMSYSADWQTIIAKYVAMYLAASNHTMTPDESTMFTSTVLLMPFEKATALMDLHNNYQKVIPFTDSVFLSWWLANRDICIKYFDYLVSKSNDSMVTIQRLVKLVPCRDTCDFSAVMFGKSTSQIIAFAQQALPLVNPTVICSCRKSIGKYLKTCTTNCTQSDLGSILQNRTIPNCAIFEPTDLSVTNLVSTAQSGSGGNSQMSIEDAKTIVRKMQATGQSVSVSQFADLIQAFTMDQIANLTNKDCSDYIQTILKYCGNIPTDKLQLLFQKYLTYAASQSTLKSAVLTILNNNNPVCYNAIDLKLFKQAALSYNDTAVDVYNALSKQLKLLISQTQVNSLDSTNAATACLTCYTLSDLQKLQSNTDLLSQIVNFNLDGVNSFRLKYLTDALYSKLLDLNATNPWSALSDSMIDKIDPAIFLALNADNMTVLSKSASFAAILQKISAISIDRCKDFPADAVRTFINLAVQAFGYWSSKTSLNSTDLDTIGGFFAVRLPLKYLLLIDAQSFVNRIDYFKSVCFQLNAQDSASFSTYLQNVVTQTKVTLGKLGSLVYYLPKAFIQSTFQQSDKDANSQKVLENIQHEKDCNTPAVNTQRQVDGIATADNTDSSQRSSDSSSGLVDTGSSSATGRRRRQASTLTCATIKSNTANGYGANAYSVSQLTGLSQSDFEDCLSIFGNSSNSWSNTYLSAFYTTIKGYYSNLATLKSTVIADMGIIAYQFSTTELQQFPLASLDAVSSLGKLDSLSAAQASALVTAMKSSGQTVTSSSTLAIMGNLVCGLSTSDMSSVTTATYTAIQTQLSKLTAKTCANLNSWWTLAVQSYAPSSIYTSANLAAVGSVASGMSVNDLNTNIASASNGADLVNSFSDSALQIMSADLKSAITTNPTLSSALEPSQQSAIGLLGKTTTTTQSGGYSTVFNPVVLVLAVVSVLML